MLTRGRLPIFILLSLGLVAMTSWLQGRFARSDAAKGVAIALAYRPAPGAPSVFERIVARGEGDPRCDGEVVSTFIGDVRVICATPGQPGTGYAFRVLLGRERAPRPEGDAARALLDEPAAPQRPGAAAQR
ncbi:MAG: hypothetical protein ACJ79R_14050 [Anaeromyxobacteraceae bacterium]